MTYRVHPGAERDLANASDFYRRQAGGLVARRFLDEFERVAHLVARNPPAGAEFRTNRRKFHLRVFPFTVVHGYLTDGIEVLVVRHQSRHPSFWMGRK